MIQRCAALVALLLLAPSVARAGGFYLTERGTRPLGRGGAYVAGVDAPDALWMNPAGLSYSGRQVLVDFSLPVLDASFTRIDDAGMRLPTVSASVPPIPIPMLAYSEDFGLRDLTFGLGVFAPNAALLTWPSSVGMDPAPQRYSLLSMNGSLLANLAIGVAWRPIPELSIGLTGQLTVGTFAVRTTLSACEGFLCTQPENPEYDALTQVNIPFLVSPTGGLGVIYDPGPVRIGVSAQLPTAIAGDASLAVRLPSAAAFDGAYVDGSGAVDPRTGHRAAVARVGLDFPWILRAGVELRAVEHLRVEAAFVVEGWSVQKALSVRPYDVYLRNVVAIGDYQVGPIDIPRNMSDVFSGRLGAEYDVAPVTVRTGFAYETGAFSDRWLSPLTLDSDKVLLSVGGSVDLSDEVSIDATFAYSIMSDRVVRTNCVPQSNPIRPALTPPASCPQPAMPASQSQQDIVGNGDYRMDAFVFSVGARWRIEPVQRVQEDAQAARDAEVARELEQQTQTPPQDDVQPEAETAPEPQPEVTPPPVEEPAAPAEAPRRRGRGRRPR